jgi:DNA-binding response OmpR family regulator
LLKLALKHAGLDFEIALIEDGSEAVAFIHAQDNGSVDLAIVDLNVPKKNGLEILAAMRESAAFDNVPLIVFTSSASVRERAMVENHGIARYL